MQNVITNIQTGKGSAISRLLKSAERAEKKGDLARAATFRRNAEFLKSQSPTVWG